jgi:hypothetical protein
MAKPRILKPIYAGVTRTSDSHQDGVRQAKSKLTRRVSALLAESRPDSEMGEPNEKKSPQRFKHPNADFFFWGQRPARLSQRDHLIFSNEVPKWGGHACVTCAGELNRGLRVQRKRSVQEGLPLVQWSVQRNGATFRTWNETGNQI